MQLQTAVSAYFGPDQCEIAPGVDQGSSYMYKTIADRI